MTNKNIYRSLGGLDPELILKAAPAEKVQKKKKNSWVKWASLAACFCLVIVGVFHFVIPFFPNQSPVSIWPKTHYETTSFDEIVAVCGTQIFNNIPQRPCPIRE